MCVRPIDALRLGVIFPHVFIANTITRFDRWSSGSNCIAHLSKITFFYSVDARKATQYTDKTVVGFINGKVSRASFKSLNLRFAAVCFLTVNHVASSVLACVSTRNLKH